MTTVEKIHNEIDTAEDRLLTEARRIIALNIDTSDKAERLERIGFVNSEVVVRSKQKKQTLVSGKDQAELIEHYKQSYPFQKFLTEEELDRICAKYSLIYAPVSTYKKDVPEKNVRDIENAPSLKRDDTASVLVQIEYIKFWYNEVDDKIKRLINKGTLLPLTYHSTSDMVFEENLKKYILSTGYTGNIPKYLFTAIRYSQIKKEGLFIAAPKSHFDLSGLKNKGKGWFNFEIREVKDPIVFRYVRGGIQVITKWGIEAEDKDLVNEKMN